MIAFTVGLVVLVMGAPPALADVTVGQKISQFIWRYQSNNLGPLRACRIVNGQQDCDTAAGYVTVFAEASLQGRGVTWSQRITIQEDNGDTWDITQVAECRDGNGAFPEGSCGEKTKSCADTGSICGWGPTRQWTLQDNSDYTIKFKTYAKVQCGGCWYNNWLFQIPDPGTGYFRTRVLNCYNRQTSPCVF
jgi:hypothetical protein